VGGPRAQERRGGEHGWRQRPRGHRGDRLHAAPHGLGDQGEGAGRVRHDRRRRAGLEGDRDRRERPQGQGPQRRGGRGEALPRRAREDPRVVP